MHKRGFFSLALGLVLMGQGAFAGTVDWKVVTDLDRFEPFDALVFQAGHLWVGSSRSNLAASYKLQVFDSAGNSVATQTLTHSLRGLHAYGADGVITVGVSVADQATHYTTATLKGVSLKAQARPIPISAYGNEAAGRPGALYFTDPGGLDDGGPIGEAARTIFTLRGNSPRYLKARIRNPHSPVLVGNALYVVEHPSIMSGGRNLVRIDLKTETPTSLYSGTDIIRVLSLDGGKQLALADRGANEVVIVDTATGQAAKHIPISAGTPRGLGTLDHCLVVGSEQAKQVTFIDLRTDKVVGTWDLSVAGTKLYGILSLAVDPASGRVYVRSAYPDSVVSPSQDADRNSVVLAEEKDGATAKACR
jgi:hypothetical protein